MYWLLYLDYTSSVSRDYTSSFIKTGKLKPMDVMMKIKQFLDALAKLRSGPLSNATFGTCETLVCHLYEQRWSVRLLYVMRSSSRHMAQRTWMIYCTQSKVCESQFNAIMCEGPQEEIRSGQLCCQNTEASCITKVITALIVMDG